MADVPRSPIFIRLQGPDYIYDRNWYRNVELLNPRPRNQYDWPVPNIVGYNVSLRTWTQSPKVVVTSIRPPPVADTRLAREVEYPIGLRSAVNQLVQFTPLAKRPVPNFEGYSGRVQDPYPTSLRTWAIGPVQSIVVAAPPLNYDYPVPRGAEYPTSLRTWTNRAQTIVLSIAPPAVYDYPVPRGAEYPTALRTWTNAIRTPQPPSNYDYPLPRTVEYATGFRTLVNQMVQFTPQRTVMNHDYPMPRSAEYPTALRTWAIGPQQGITAFTLVASQGGFVLVGQDALFQVLMPSAVTTFSLAGQDAIFATVMPSSNAGFILNGQDAPSIVSLTSSPSAFVFSGIDAVSLATLAANKGTFVMVGISVPGGVIDEAPHSIPFIVTLGRLTAR